MAQVPAVFRGEFPLTAQFRSGPRNPVKSYDQWKSKQFLPEGFPVDLQTNVLRFAPENYEYADQFAQENPSMLIMSTWRAASGNPKGLDAEGNGDPLGQSVIDFPGHFVISPGTYISSDIYPSSTTFQVADGSMTIKGPALLVETDEFGGVLWERFEYILIQSVSGDTVTAKRAFNGSPDSRSFSKFTTYVANMPWDFRVNTDYTDWFFNFGESCPRDSQNRTAMDVILKEMVYPMKPGGALEHIGGLDLASGPLVLDPTNADYDLDGKQDSPLVYRRGVRRFYERVREVLGDERVLTTELDYEMLGFINGVNQEGLARPSDPWREVSRTVNDVLAWKKISNLPMVSLAFVQYLNKEEDLKRVQMHRLLNGYSVCLGLAADVDRGDGLEALERMELFKGGEREPHWLGKMVSPLVRPAAMTPNLLLSNGSTSSNDWSGIMPNIGVLRADLLVDGDELVIRPNGKGTGYVTLQLNFELAKETDLTVFFEARSDDDNVVRHIKIPRISVAVETGAVRAAISNVDYVLVGYFLRRAKAGSVMFDMRFTDGGDIRVRNLSVHSATDTLACEFENGVVLVNPSLDEVSLNLEDIFPVRTGYRRLTSFNVSADLIPSKYMPQYEQAMQLNDGQLVENAQSVKVLERNALFLLADPTDPPEPSAAPSNVPTPYGQTGSPTSFVTQSPTVFKCEDTTEKFELQPGTLVGCWYVQRFPSKTERRCSETTFQGPVVGDFCPNSCGTCGEISTAPVATVAPLISSEPSILPSSAPTSTAPVNFVDSSHPTGILSNTPSSAAPVVTSVPTSPPELTLTPSNGPMNYAPMASTAPTDPPELTNAPTNLRTPTLPVTQSPTKTECDDVEGKFELKPGIFVGCWYVQRFSEKTERRCLEKTFHGLAVSEFCPKSCDTCNGMLSIAPMFSGPSADPPEPTVAPTSVPTSYGKTGKGKTGSPTLHEPKCEDAGRKFELRQGTLVGCWYVQRYPSKTEKRCSEITFQGPIVHEFCPLSCGKCYDNGGILLL